MASRQGLEARFIPRFTRLGEATAESIRATDDAGRVADQLNTARGIINTQQENIGALFSTAIEVVSAIDHFQQSSGVRQVKNIPAPTAVIKESYGKQLGYVQMTMRFLSAGIQHFMHEAISAQGRIENLEKTMKHVADYTGDVPLVGELQELTFEDLEGPGDQPDLPEPVHSGSTTSEDTGTTASVPTSPASAKTPAPADKKKVVNRKK